MTDRIPKTFNGEPEYISGEESPRGGLSTTDVVRRLDRLWSGDSRPQAGPFADISGSRVRQYVIERPIGHGGFGIVYKAHDPELKRDVALKIPRPEVLLDDERLQRFEAEAKAAAQLDHPSIVPLYEAQLTGTTPFLASAFCPGPNLQTWLDDTPALQEPDEVATFVAKIAAATQFAHDNGVIHRDLKPSNILLMPLDHEASDLTRLSDFEPRLTDFGLSRLVEDGTTTRSSIRLGTPRYMSPEQALGTAELNAPTLDVYSLGVLLYRLLTGRLPFDGETEFQIFDQIISSAPQEPLRLNPRIPRDLNSICLKCLEKNPQLRYLTAADLGADLARYLRREPTLARPLTNAGRALRWVRRAPLKAALLAVSLLAVIGTFTALLFHVNTVNEHAATLLAALGDAQTEREAAEAARGEADIARKQAEQQREHARNVSYRSDVRLAFQLFDNGQYRDVDRLLSSQIPDGRQTDLRGPEWHVLRARLSSSWQVIGKHSGAATECVLNSDRTVAYSAGIDGKIVAWDMQTMREIKTFAKSFGEVHGLALSPDGTRLAIGAKPLLVNEAVSVVDVETEEIHTRLQSHETTIESIGFSPDGRWLAAGSRYQPVQLTRIADGKTFSLASDRRNRTVSFSADSKFLVVGDSVETMQLWPVDSEQPGESAPVKGFGGSRPYVFQFSPVRSLLAIGYRHSQYLSIHDQSAKQGRRLAMSAYSNNGSSRFESLAFSPTATHLAAGDASGRVVGWDLVKANRSDSRLQPDFAATPHESAISSMQFVDDRRLLTTGDDGFVCLTAPDASGATVLRWPDFRMTDAVLSGEDLLLSTSDGAVRHFRLADLSRNTAEDPSVETGLTADQSIPPKTLISNIEPVTCMASSPNEHMVAVGTAQGGVRVYERESGRLKSIIAEDRSGENLAVIDVAFSATGKRLAYASEEGLVRVIDLDSQEVVLHTAASNVRAVAFIGVSQRLAVATSDQVNLMDCDSGRISRSIPASDVVRIAQTSEKGQVAFGQYDGRCLLLSDGEAIEHVIPDHRQGIQSLVFSSDDRSLITADWTGFLVFSDPVQRTVLGKVYLPGIWKADVRVLCTPNQLIVVRSAIDDVAGQFGGTELTAWSW